MGEGNTASERRHPPSRREPASDPSPVQYDLLYSIQFGGLFGINMELIMNFSCLFYWKA